MKRFLATFISCFVLLCTTLSAPALAEVKENVQQADTSALQDALTKVTNGIQSVLDDAQTNIAELLNTSGAFFQQMLRAQKNQLFLLRRISKMPKLSPRIFRE